jgi:hypothetical protein
MKSILTLITFFASTLFLLAQTKDSTIPELLKMDKYKNDGAAEAVIIYDLGSTRFADTDRGYEVNFTRKCRIKILTTAGLEFAEVAIPLYVKDFDQEQLIDFKAVTYNLVEGNTVTTTSTKRDLLEERINNGWIQKKIALPGVKVGSVVDFEYELASPFLFNIQDWEFQHEIPIIYSEYEAKMIPFYTYTYITIGTTKFDEFKSYETTGLKRRISGVEFQEMVYKFVMKDLPAFRDLDFITTPTDYKVKLDFQLSKYYSLDGAPHEVMTTWPKMISELYKSPNFGKYLKSCKSESKKVIQEKFPQSANNVETLKNLVNYVKENYNWDGRNGQFASKKAKEFITQKSGNVGEVNLFLTALLREAGIDAYPVVISTRDHGRIYSTYPFSHFFDYVVVCSEVDGKTYLSDATEKLTTFDQLPERCVNDKGLVVKEKEEKWVSLATTVISEEGNSFFYNLNDTKDSLICKYSYTSKEYDGIRDKKAYLDDKQKFIDRKYESSFDQLDTTAILATTDSRNFVSQCGGRIQPTIVDNLISFKPFMNYCIDENPFNKKSRLYDIDLTYPRQRKYEALILLPGNAEPITQPENVSVDNENFSMNYNVTIADNTIKIKADYCLKKSIYTPDMYFKLQAFFDKVIKKLNQDVQIRL